MDVSADYYAVLGVEAGADGAAIRAAYRNQMRRFHPDVNASDEAVDKATALNEAYACLGDPASRATYDELRQARRTRPAAAFNAAPRPFTPQPRTTWSHQHSYMIDPVLAAQRKKWRVISLGLASLITVTSFAATSTVPPVVPAPPAVTTMWVTDAAPVPVAGDASCGLRDGDAGCEKPAVGEGPSTPR